MVEVEESIEIGVPAAVAFGVLHDFSRRLTWDDSMAAARLEGDAAPAVGSRTQCIAKWAFARLEVSFEYLELEEGLMAVLEMVKRPWPIRRMSAIVRHRDRDGRRNATSYRFRVSVGPRYLAAVLEPVVAWCLRLATRRRLRALKRYLETTHG